MMLMDKGDVLIEPATGDQYAIIECHRQSDRLDDMYFELTLASLDNPLCQRIALANQYRRYAIDNNHTDLIDDHFDQMTQPPADQPGWFLLHRLHL